jgi:hypothetical protein
MFMPARKYQAGPQQEREAALELLTTSDFYSATSERQPVRDRRSGLQQAGAERRPLAR